MCMKSENIHETMEQINNIISYCKTDGTILFLARFPF